jgi:hypothetical protein
VDHVSAYSHIRPRLSRILSEVVREFATDIKGYSLSVMLLGFFGP